MHLHLEHVAFGPVDISWAQRMAAIPSTVTYGKRSFPAPGAYHHQLHQWASYPVRPSLGRLFALAQRDWHVRGQTGCQFARLAARAAGTLRWDYLVLGQAEPTAEVMAALDEHIKRAAAAPAVEVVSVLVPAAVTLDQAKTVVTTLPSHTAFWLELDEVIDGGRRLHLRYPISDGVQAWVMAFGPSPVVPNTRRGPYLELAIRVKPKPKWIFHRLTSDRDVAHLADVPMQMSDRHWEDRWQTTMARTRMILGGAPDDVSAAKVTLTVPLAALD